jgi:hypothetical protein
MTSQSFRVWHGISIKRRPLPGSPKLTNTGQVLALLIGLISILTGLAFTLSSAALQVLAFDIDSLNKQLALRTGENQVNQSR